MAHTVHAPASGLLPSVRAGRRVSAEAGHSRAEGLLLPAGRAAGSSACVVMTQPAASSLMSVWPSPPRTLETVEMPAAAGNC